MKLPAGVDHVEPHRPALDLSAEQERDVEAQARPLRAPCPSMARTCRIARPMSWAARNRVGDFVQGLDLARFGVLEPLGQEAYDGLRDGEVSGRGEREHPLARDRTRCELAVDRDVVEPGIRAGVGDHDEALIDEDAGAVGHDGSRPAWKGGHEAGNQVSVGRASRVSLSSAPAPGRS